MNKHLEWTIVRNGEWKMSNYLLTGKVRENDGILTIRTWRISIYNSPSFITDLFVFASSLDLRKAKRPMFPFDARFAFGPPGSLKVRLFGCQRMEVSRPPSLGLCPWKVWCPSKCSRTSTRKLTVVLASCAMARYSIIVWLGLRFAARSNQSAHTPMVFEPFLAYKEPKIAVPESMEKRRRKERKRRGIRKWWRRIPLWTWSHYGLDVTWTWSHNGLVVTMAMAAW